MRHKKKIVIGDIHYRELVSGGRKLPYKLAIEEFWNWFCNSEYNDPDEYNEILFLGDLTEKSLNQGETNHFFLDLFQYRIKIPKIIILEGNHDKNREGSNNNTFKSLPNISIISEYVVRQENNCTILYLPFFYGKQSAEDKTMKQLYENLHVMEDIDYCFAHLMDETRDFGGHKGIDLSHLNIKQRVFGHDHNFNLDEGGNYLGSISPNSYTEREQKKYIYIIDTNTKKGEYKEIPVFLNYKEVEYPNDLVFDDNDNYVIWTVKEALDKNSVIDYYTQQCNKLGKDFYYRRIEKKKSKKEKEIEEKRKETDNMFIEDYLEMYYNEVELNKNIKDKINNVVLGG